MRGDVAAIGREPMPMTADWAKLLSEQEIWILDGPAGRGGGLAGARRASRPCDDLERGGGARRISSADSAAA